ncbi:MAG: hypothetical protein J6Y02_19600 [Pseudobutyrivibrio sp.]|nr:hypothetical protein [Pseudobutyrivibrio sp.]
MLNFNEYYVECEVAVLAKATGRLLPLDGGIVRLFYKRMLKMKDYGVFEPEGWEYEIDESPFYDLDEYQSYRPEMMEMVAAYGPDTKWSIAKDLKILEVYKTQIIRINTDKKMFIERR